MSTAQTCCRMEPPNPCVVGLMLVLGAVFACQLTIPPFNDFALQYLALDTSAFISHGRLWQAVTSIFLHGSLWHLFSNLLFLYFFGNPLANGWRRGEFIAFFLAAGVAASFCFYGFHQALTLIRGDGRVVGLGASGAIFGLMAAYAMVFRGHRVLFFFIPMRAEIAVGICMVIEILLLVAGTQDGVGHIAHLGGAIFGVLWLRLVWKWHDRRAGVSRRQAKAASRIAGLEVMGDDPK